MAMISCDTPDLLAYDDALAQLTGGIVPIGKVVEVGLDAEATSVDLAIAIEAPYAPLVKTNTVFWNASGIHAGFSLFSGASIDIESLRAGLTEHAEIHFSALKRAVLERQDPAYAQ